MLVLTLLVGAAIALWFTLAQLPRYRAEATLSIISGNPTADPQVAVGLADALAPTLVAYMETQTFAAEVIVRSELSMSPTDLLRSVTVWHVPGTHLLRVQATSNYPQQAERVANGVAQTVIDLTADQLQETIGVQATSPELASLTARAQDELNYYLDLAEELRVRLAEYRSQPPSSDRDEGIARLSAQLLDVQDTVGDLRGVLLQSGAAPGIIAPYAIALLDPAVVPVAPLPRPFGKNLAIGLAASLLVGLALALIPESLDYTVATPEELEDVLGVTVLGAVARIGGRDTQDDPIEQLVARNYPRSPIAEAFRTLRTNIRFARPDMRRGCLLVTSAQPGEGKSLVSSNLAVAIAQEGRTAIIIDADLRRPTLHRFFGLPNRLGFTSLVMDETLTVDDALHDTDVPGLQVITSGPLPPNPLDMLASQRAQDLLAILRDRCDMLLLDSPPVLSVTDAMLLASHADAALLVTAARSTRRDLVLKAFETLKRSNIDIIGTVLNKVRQSELGYYYSHYYYGYYYGTPGEVPEEIPVVGRMQEPGAGSTERP
ncbi:MAG: polysaccharide biosynthesis tyrosine autokinase [Anaerolineae bacterium]|nr:polysaccharide biosynthesis tyrosine autokinase [Anaerolineae bacterium]